MSNLVLREKSRTIRFLIFLFFLTQLGSSKLSFLVNLFVFGYNPFADICYVIRDEQED